MKKFIIYSLFIFVLANPLFLNAGELTKRDDVIERISSNVLQHFGYTFYRAKNVSWTINNTYQKATFTLNDKVTYAIYDLKNNFLVATQTVTVNELPEKSKLILEKNYTDYKPVNILKIVARPADYELEDDTNSYWLELINDKESLIAVTLPQFDVSVVKREKK